MSNIMFFNSKMSRIPVSVFWQACKLLFKVSIKLCLIKKFEEFISNIRNNSISPTVLNVALVFYAVIIFV